MTSAPNLRSQIDRALMDFNHILLCAPSHFPTEEATDLQTEFKRLIARLNDILNRVRYPQARQWIALSIGETQEALEAYEAGDEAKGSGLIQAAEAHFRSYLEGRKGGATFLAGPEGIEKM